MGRPLRTAADREFMRQMGERLRWVREAAGCPPPSQEEMATRVGIHQTSWSLYERGLRWPDQFEIVRLCAKLQITVGYLTEGNLQGVEPNLAIQLAARHPELVLPNGTVASKGTRRPSRNGQDRKQ